MRSLASSSLGLRHDAGRPSFDARRRRILNHLRCSAASACPDYSALRRCKARNHRADPHVLSSSRRADHRQPICPGWVETEMARRIVGCANRSRSRWMRSRDLCADGTLGRVLGRRRLRRSGPTSPPTMPGTSGTGGVLDADSDALIRGLIEGPVRPGALLRADPPIEEVYFRAFSRTGCARSPPAAPRRARDDVAGNPDKRRRTGPASGRRERFWEAYVRRVRSTRRGDVTESCLAARGRIFLRPEAWSVYPTSLPSSAELRAGGYSLAIVRSGTRLSPASRRPRLSKSFSAIWISAVERSGEAARGIFLRAASGSAFGPEEALHVGDSLEEDYAGARQPALRPVAIGGRHTDVEDRISVARGDCGKTRDPGRERRMRKPLR